MNGPSGGAGSPAAGRPLLLVFLQRSVVWAWRGRPGGCSNLSIAGHGAAVWKHLSLKCVAPSGLQRLIERESSGSRRAVPFSLPMMLQRFQFCWKLKNKWTSRKRKLHNYSFQSRSVFLSPPTKDPSDREPFLWLTLCLSMERKDPAGLIVRRAFQALTCSSRTEVTFRKSKGQHGVCRRDFSAQSFQPFP